ncbi:MAG: flagellar basal body L-ring protein FlgH [Acidobacteria bacterium]|nr:flagellar basal body L-ring protein FlgH [Acidobacteriota bacterium]
MFVLPPAGAEKSAPLSPLDQFIQDALNRPAAKSDDHRGSIWTPASHLADAARDLRASQVDDVLTILVVERASAVSRGSVQSSRQANANAGVGALGGITRATGPLANLANLSSETDLQGQGATTRETVLNTSLAARVAHVLHNGYLVIEAAKEVQVNSERQLVTVRGVVRPEDISSGNVIRSDRITQMELRINGKGVVGDAVRRPNFLYRILLGILPF